MKKLARTSMLLSLTEFSLIFLAIVRNKVVSLIIGPEGLGIYGLLSSFFTIILVISASWMNTVLVKYISEYYSQKEFKTVSQIINIGFVSAVTLSSFLITLSIVFRNFIISAFFNHGILLEYYLIFSLSCIGFSIKVIFDSTLQALMDISKVIKYRVITTIIDLAFTLILVYFYNILGFMISFIISSCIHIVYIYVFLKRQSWYKFSFDFKNKPVIKKLLNFGKLNIFLSIVTSVSQYYQRIIISISLNIRFVGFFQASQSIMNYMGILNRGTIYTMLPLMSTKIDLNERNLKLNEYLRFTILTNAFVSTLTLIYSPYLIRLLYSSAFLDLKKYIFIFILAQFIITIELIFQSVVMGMALLKAQFIGSSINILTWIIIPISTIRFIGFSSLPISLIAASLIALTYQYNYLRRQIGLNVARSNYYLFFICLLIIIATLIAFDTFILKSIQAIVCAILFFILLNKNEKIFFYNKLSYLRLKLKEF